MNAGLEDEDAISILKIGCLRLRRRWKEEGGEVGFEDKMTAGDALSARERTRPTNGHAMMQVRGHVRARVQNGGSAWRRRGVRNGNRVT